MVRAGLPAPLAASRVLVILRGLEPAAARRAAAACVPAGLPAVEVTLDSPSALDTVRALVGDGVPLVGAGTVLTLDAAKAAVDAGAALLVSPHTDATIVEWAAAEGVAALPGAFTPTEIVRAWSAGATAVKLFPAGSVGPGYLRELRGPLGHVPTVPTGGVTADTAGAWLAAGAAAVAVGGWLTADLDRLPERASALAQAVAQAVAQATGER
jgi:2-dehydro-3-deoxyphosphogluconate aldolase/(4S)-4-hydroxy-2-oxoglutarate aldolase